MKLQSFLAVGVLLIACERSQNLGNPKPDGAVSGNDGGEADSPVRPDAWVETGGVGAAGVVGTGGGGIAGTSGLGGSSCS